MDFIEIEILNWKKFNPRRDYKKPWWFALSNTITSDPMFSEFSDAEFRAWIHILCTSSVQNSNRAKVFFKHAERSAGIKRKTLLDAIEKLKILQVIQVPGEICTEPVRDPNATNRTNKQTDRGEVAVAAEESFQVEWNQRIKSLPKARTWGPDRLTAQQKILKEHTFDDWKEVCDKTEKSEFLSGRNGKWSGCGVDWVLSPKNFRKILEGNYDRNNSTGDTGGWAD